MLPLHIPQLVKSLPLHTWSLKMIRLTGGASPYRPLQGVTQPLGDARSRILCYKTFQASVTIYDALVKIVVLSIPSRKKPWPLIKPNHIADQNWKTRHHATLVDVTINAVLFATFDASCVHNALWCPMFAIYYLQKVEKNLNQEDRHKR